jgi:anaphase-promoting complex subunit 2
MDGEFADDIPLSKDAVDLDEKVKICNNDGEMDVDVCYNDRRFLENSKMVNNIGKVVLDLKSLGFTSMAEDAYASAIFLLLKVSLYMKFKIWIFRFSSLSYHLLFHLYVALINCLCLRA